MGRLDASAEAMRERPSRKRFIAILGLLLVCALQGNAHVGSPDVYYEGDAGPYRLFVTVRMPQVIPGVAEIQVRCGSNDVRAIEIVPMTLSGPGSNLPPTPDLAQRSKEDPQFFSGTLWLMEFGALKVRVTVDGSKGKGELAVPVPSFAQSSLKMETPLGGLLAFLMLFLAIGAVFSAGAAVREGNLEPGETPPPARTRQARFVMGLTAVAVSGVLYLGWAWWSADASTYQRYINLAKPPAAEMKLENGNRLILRAKGQDTGWTELVKMEEVIPDHNHLMHLFLFSVPGMERMWHLHPERMADGAFREELPAMSAGKYQVFADIVDKSGLPWTLVGGLELPQVRGKELEGDDSYWSGTGLGEQASDRTVAQLADGGRMVWQRPRDRLNAKTPMSFRFSVEDKHGKPARDLEPYMGMAGHAEFVSADLKVFAHVHPAGSVTMAALELARTGPGREPSPMSPGMSMPMPMSSGPVPPEVSFPYGFPRPGHYRIFVQIKRAGQIETGVFDAQVQ
jgi:hypothetical protein